MSWRSQGVLLAQSDYTPKADCVNRCLTLAYYAFLSSMGTQYLVKVREESRLKRSRTSSIHLYCACSLAHSRSSIHFRPAKAPHPLKGLAQILHITIQFLFAGCFSPYRTLPLTIALLHKKAAIGSTGLMITGAMLAAAIDQNINADCMGVFVNHGTMVCTRINDALTTSVVGSGKNIVMTAIGILAFPFFFFFFALEHGLVTSACDTA
jgi:hypothetical protein